MAQEFTFPQSGDADDAEHFAAMIGQSNLSDYVERGLEFTYDASGPSVDVSSGKAYVSRGVVNASSTGEEIYDANYVVQVPTQTVSLTASSENFVYLEPNFGTDDSGTVAAYTSEQTGNVLHIGTIDTSTDEVTQSNRVPNVETQNVNLSDDGTLYFGDNDDYSQFYDPDTGKLTFTDQNDNVLGAADSSSWQMEVDLDMQDNSLLDVRAIGGGGDEVAFTDPTNLPAGDIDADEINIGRGLEDDGTGTLQFDEDVNYSFTAGIDVGGDITDSGTTVWDSSAGHIGSNVLEHNSVTVAGNDIALGGSASIDHADLSNVSTDDHHSRYTDGEALNAVQSQSLNLQNPTVSGHITTDWLSDGDATGYDKYEITWETAGANEAVLLLASVNEGGARLAGTLNGWRQNTSSQSTTISQRIILSLSDEATPQLGAATLQTFGYTGGIDPPDIVTCTYNGTDYYAIRYKGSSAFTYPHQMEFSGSYSQNIRFETVAIANVSNVSAVDPNSSQSFPNTVESNVAMTAPRMHATETGTGEGGFMLSKSDNVGMARIIDDTVLYSDISKQLKVRSNVFGSFDDVFTLDYTSGSDVKISLQRGEKAVMREGQGNHREIYISSSEPSGWSDGDIWFEPQ